MRTTIDLPDDVLDAARALARTRKLSLGQAVADLARRGINPPEPAEIRISPITGLPVLHFGGPPITQADIDAMDDEEDEKYLSSLADRPRVQ